jgi:hypothetical protein
MHPRLFDFGVGSTQELSLRVSVAALVRVLVKNPEDGALMLALERKANLYNAGEGIAVEIKVQPFGGAVRIMDLHEIYNLIGEFNFDSERSRSEQDFRLFIKPSTWMGLREFCIETLNQPGNPFLESDPGRELAEEFYDALNVKLNQDQYLNKAVGTLIEDNPISTDNAHSKGSPTVRVYRIFEATITNPALTHRIFMNSESISHQDLCALAFEDSQNGGKGRGNAVLVMPISEITDYYQSLLPLDRNDPRQFKEYYFESTVPMILEGLTVPKYTISSDLNSV